MIERPRIELFAWTILLQSLSMLVFLVFLAAAMVAQSREQPVVAWASVLLGGLLWAVLAVFISIRTNDLVEWILYRVGVLPHNPESVIQYGVPRGFDQFAALIDEQSSRLLILSASTTGWLLTHELGKLLTQIERDFCRLNLCSPVPDEAQRVKEGIAAACEYIEALKALREGLPQRIRSVEIGELIEGVRRQLTLDDQARVEQWSGPPTYVCGIKPLLGAIIGNLIMNAVKHTPKDRRIYPSLQAGTNPSGNTVVFRVEDEGPDIPDTVAADLFRPSVASLISQLAGTGGGLGLPLIRTYAELHTGRIDYIRPSEGCRKAFVVTLPKGTSPAPNGESQP